MRIDGETHANEAMMASSLQNAPKKLAATPTPAKPARKKNVVPDGIDLRDRVYSPSLAVVPVQMLAPQVDIPVLDQHETSACTGFALATVIFHLQARANRDKSVTQVSPYMLYSMARRYDEFPGDPNADTGSSLRGRNEGVVQAWSLR